MCYRAERLFHWRTQGTQSRDASPGALHRQSMLQAALMQAYEVPERILKQIRKGKSKGHCSRPQRGVCINLSHKVIHIDCQYQIISGRNVNFQPGSKSSCWKQMPSPTARTHKARNKNLDFSLLLVCLPDSFFFPSTSLSVCSSYFFLCCI